MSESDKVQFKRTEDFDSLYANNVQFEASIWDLKMVFGQLDQSQPKSVIEQHTAISMSWSHAKIMAYYVLVNVIIHQSREGILRIPSSVTPPRPDVSDPSIESEDGRKAVQYLAWVHDQFFGPSPFVPPDPS